MSEHLDLDLLADALADDVGGGFEGGAQPEHLRACTTCAAALADLRTALTAVATDLAALPAVPPVPESLERSVVPTGAAATTVLPSEPVTRLDDRRRGAPTWLLAVGGLAAAAALVIGGGLFLTSNSSDSSRGSTAATSPTHFPVNTTGADYTTPGTLQAALPGLLHGKQETLDAVVPSRAAGAAGVKTAADPLARLRTTPGLAGCLASLTDPNDPGVPLALDYASYKGAPALVVVLPASKPSKLDIWVVGASCNQLESDLLVYVKADRPQ
jgi:hypothetical protein